MEIQSSNISEADYDGKDLIITFKKGGVYRYLGVPQSVFNAFISADSQGKYFTQNIKLAYEVRKEA